MAPSVCVVLSLGALSGGVIKGVTGFGNAIMNLLVWVSFTAAGVDGGPLRLAVLADSIGCVVCSIPLLVMTAAHKTADWRLVITLLLFTTLGAPVGTALLTHLDARWVELVMGCVLLLVICIHVKLHNKLFSIRGLWRSRRRTGAYSGLLNDDSAATPASRAQCSTSSRSAVPASGVVDTDASLQSLAVDCLPSPLPSRRPSLPEPSPHCGGTTRQMAGPAGASADLDCAEAPGGISFVHVVTDNSRNRISLEAKACSPAVTHVRPGLDFSTLVQPRRPVIGADPTRFDPNQLGTLSPSPMVTCKDAAIVNISASCSGQLWASAAALNPGDATLEQHKLAPSGAQEAHGPTDPGSVSDTQPLLGKGAGASDVAGTSIATYVHVRAACNSSASQDGEETQGAMPCVDAAHGSASGVSYGSCWARLRRRIAQMDLREMSRILLFGSVAGSASGVMGGMTGIGGPPIMFMYEKLKVPKEIVRGTNAVNNVLQVRLISYIILGVFKKQDMPLYAVTSLVGLVGVFIGNALAGRLDQRGFSRVLVALMIICCVLLFASAAGIKGHAAQG